MRILCSVTIISICWLMCSSKAIPFISTSDLGTVVSTDFQNDARSTLNICDIMEIVKIASHLEFSHYEMEDVKKLEQSVEELLANFLNGRQSRQVGYNINSFGLRFGKRDQS